MRTWMAVVVSLAVACAKPPAPVDAAAAPPPASSGERPATPPGGDAGERPADAPAPTSPEGSTGERPAEAAAATPEPSEASTGTRPPAPNTDFTAAIAWADGTSSKGHVIRVERSVDWYGSEWTDEPRKLTVTLEGGGTEVEVPWTDLRSIAIVYGTKDDISCDQDSSFTPTMYTCTLKTTTTIKTRDDKQWSAAGRHKWRLTTDTGETFEFWLWKLPAREQEASVPELGTTGENVELQLSLQRQLTTAKTGKVPKSITVTVP